MRINNLDIKGFGKFNNFSIDLSDKMNIIFGSNESGKSTLQMFIKAMFYNLKKNRLESDWVIDDIKRYQPWNLVDFQGSILYTLDDNISFRVERNFSTNSCIVYNQYFEDITNNFDKSRERGVLFAKSHFGITESIFENTVFVKQMETRISSNDNTIIRDKLANLYQTGSLDTSYGKATEVLKDALKDYVGTDKTSTKPLNKINTKLEELTKLKNNLIEKRNLRLTLNTELNDLYVRKEKLLNDRSICNEFFSFFENCLHELYILESLQESSHKLSKEIDQDKNELLEYEHKLSEYKSFNTLSDDIESTLIVLTTEINKEKEELNNIKTLPEDKKIEYLEHKKRLINIIISVWVALDLLFIILRILKYNTLIYFFSISLLIVLFSFLLFKCNRVLNTAIKERTSLSLILDGISRDLQDKQGRVNEIYKACSVDDFQSFLVKKYQYNNLVLRFIDISAILESLENDHEQNALEQAKILTHVREKALEIFLKNNCSSNIIFANFNESFYNNIGIHTLLDSKSTISDKLHIINEDINTIELKITAINTTLNNIISDEFDIEPRLEQVDKDLDASYDDKKYLIQTKDSLEIALQMLEEEANQRS